MCLLSRLHDLEAQEKYYESNSHSITKYISDNPKGILLHNADKGISGKSAKKRPQFMQMIKTANMVNRMILEVNFPLCS